ncbi:hypothetical protein JRQ81_009661 [Phrynocephalus forsythii]|uniref:Seipin n=1 Tax=Phrynocephalus forsythii TaxID=171643 RepID=A0A9Q0XA41_9SAUR|nr:hypothetical protein JRQ81_009661 [Phrynocephalus forsythii]
MSGGTVPFLVWAQEVATLLILRVRRTVLQTAILLCVLLLLLWISVFLYGSFYYSYMPTVSYVSPVHYRFRTDCSNSGSELCSFPTANVSFIKDTRDQKAMLHYRSSLLQILDTLAFATLFLAGFTEQKQTVEVELFSNYKEDSYTPTVGAVIEIQTTRIQIYGSQLRIHAHFTGLRYLLYNFPVTSAILGVASNFTFLSVIVLFSYLQWIWGSVWPREPLSVQVSGRERAGMLPATEEVRRRVVAPKEGVDEEEAAATSPKTEDVGSADGEEQSISITTVQAVKSSLEKADSRTESSLSEGLNQGTDAEFESVDNSSLLTEANFPSPSLEGAPSALLPPGAPSLTPGSEIRQRSICSSS